MTEKYITYRWNGRTFDVPESHSADVEKNYPDATIEMRMGDRSFDVPLAHKQDALDKYGPDITYAFDKESAAPADVTEPQPSFAPAEESPVATEEPTMNRRERRKARREGRPSWGESAAKGAGAGIVRTGKGWLDALHQLSSGMLYNDPDTGAAKRTEDYDTQMQDPTNPFRNASVMAGDTAERLSREADPTGGDKGFVDLISEGKIGLALQKGLATGTESLPMTLSAYNPYTMALNMVSMAGANYADKTLENPEVDKWKRATQAIGSAALEQVVEKFADPVFKYIGGSKGAGELTEEVAKEILERGTKEATESVSKRILNVLKNTGKDALGEGAEEVITSFGNDALGEALDLLDGDKDYGIRAQWEQMKEENPDADLGDFAKSKAKEYMDSFIGGALSGAYMSGPTQAAAETAKFVVEKNAQNEMQQAYAAGESMDFPDIYDSDDAVRETASHAVDAFTNDAGEQSISSEFIESLSSEDAFTLSRREDLPSEQRDALFNLAKAKATQEGLNKKLDDRLENEVNAQNILIDKVAENNSVVYGIYNSQPVYVMGGVSNNGSVTLPNGENGPVIVINALTGEESSVRSEEIKYAMSEEAGAYRTKVEDMLRQNDYKNREAARNTMSIRAKHRAVQQFQGKKILVDVGNGVTEVYVQNISPNGDVVIKGKKGDLGGQSFLTLKADSFYDSIYRDDTGNPIITETNQEEEEQQKEEVVPQAETEEVTPREEDYRDGTYTIFINGMPTEVEVTGQDNTADRVTYEYTDENGIRRSGSSTLGEFRAAIQQSVDTTDVPAETPRVPDTEAPAEEVATTEIPAPEEDIPLTSEDIDWDALFDQDPEAYFGELQNQFGDETLDVLNEEIDAIQEELDSLGKKRGKTQNERLENRKRKAYLQGRIEALRGMVEKLSPSSPAMPVSESPAGQPVIPADEVVPTIEETSVEMPDAPTEPATAESTQEQPESEFVVKDGRIINPIVLEQPGVEGTPNRIYIAQKDGKWGYGWHAVTDDGNESWNDTIQLENLRYNSKEEAIAGALKYLEFYKDFKKSSPSTALDSFIQYIRDTYLNNGPTLKTEPTIASEIPIPEPTTVPMEKDTEPMNAVQFAARELGLRDGGIKLLVDSFKQHTGYGNQEVQRFFGLFRTKDNGGITIEEAGERLMELDRENSTGFFDQNDPNAGINAILDAISSNRTMNELRSYAARMQQEEAQRYADAEYSAMMKQYEDEVLYFEVFAGDLKNGKALSDSAAEELNAIFAEEINRYGTDSIKTGNETGDRVETQGDIQPAGEGVYTEGEGSNQVLQGEQSVHSAGDGISAGEHRQDNNDIVEQNAGSSVSKGEPSAEKEPVSSLGEFAAEVEKTPVAPNPVKNPIDEAKKKERQLAINIKKIGLSPEAKQDLAFNAGKAVADMFATREEYDAYAENATDFGAYNADFERGVEESFANRAANAGNSQENSVPLEAEPNNYDNGEATTEGSGSGQSDSGSVRQTSDGRGQEIPQGAAESEPSQGKNKGRSKNKQVANKYPARKGNATQKLLINTFGFESVKIPNTRKETLNAIYDFMMEMSKMLGISPKSIGQGGMLGVGNLNAKARATAEHILHRNKFNFDFIDASIKFKYAKLEGIAHEWWHSLDYALGYFDSGKVRGTTTEVSDSQFTGRQETLDAVRAVIQAIKDSGYPERIKSLTTSRAALSYYLDPTEMAARAFDGYLRDMFAAAGISIEGASYEYIDTDPSQQTAEEMAVIAPAFDNLFNVLQEKEGKKPGTSVLYHIGEDMMPESDAKKFATESILTALDDSNRDVVILNDDQTEQYLKMIGADTKTQFSIDTDKPIFLSNAAIAVIGIKQEKATPEQWLKMIEKAGGLKAGEDKWMGLSDWLKSSDKKTLTKQEVLDFINENTIRIEEVNYAEIDYFAEDKKLIDAINNEFLALRKEAEDAGEWIHDAGDIAYDQMVEKYGDDFSIAFGIDLGELYVSNREAAYIITGVDLGPEREINETRFGYTTDGLDNKKEIALIVPTIDSWGSHDEIHFGDAGDGRSVAWVRFGDARTYAKEYADFYDFQGKMQKKYFPDRVIQALSGSDFDALTEEERAEFERLRNIARSIPAKNRTNRRVLVIDEIQSKRHQEGREKGYADERIVKINKRLDVLAGKMYVSGLSQEEYEERERLREELNRIPVVAAHRNAEYDMRDYERLTPQSEFSEERYQELKAIYDKTGEALKRAQGGVPDAPFDKNWHELAMKRMLRYAAENGYDAVAWTKGDQQAERYNIGGVLEAIQHYENENGRVVIVKPYNNESSRFVVNNEGLIIDSRGPLSGEARTLSDVVGKELAVRIMSGEGEEIEKRDGSTYYPAKMIKGDGIRIGGEGMKGFYDKMLPAFMNKYGKKWGVKVSDITLPHVEEAGRVMHSVPVNDAMKESVMEGQPMFYKTPNGIVYGWTDGKKIYLTKAGLNPNTPIHEYTHLWAKAMMQKNPKGWNSIKQLLKGTPIWNEVMNDANYSNIHNDEDLVASEALSRISGSENAAKMEQMAQQMIDEAKGTMRKLEARGLVQRMKDALNAFWEFVWKDLFKMTNFRSVEHVTDRVLFDLLNGTDLGTLSEGQVETQIITDPDVIAELEASPKRSGYRNVVQNEDGTFSSPMAYWLQSTKGGAKTRREMAKFELGKWEEAEENADLVDDNGHITLVKPNKGTVEVAYDPYIHNRLDPVNLQFKDAWKRDELVYVETEVAETDLDSGYHADKALLPVGVHSWSNGALILSKYDKPVRVMPWEDVADAWAKRLNGEGVEFDVVPPALRSLLVERGVEILPPHKGMGKACNEAYEKWKNSESENNSVSLPKVSEAIKSATWTKDAINELNKIVEDVEEGKAILKRYSSSELTGLLEGGSLLVGASIISRGSEGNVSSSRRRAESLEGKAAATIPAIESWAKEIGAWRDYSERSEEEIDHSYWTSGGEAQVFYLGDGRVEKIISLDYFIDPQLAIDRIAIHNSLFEETALKVTGFGTNKAGKFAIIVEQPTIIGKHTDNKEIDSYIESLGFDKIDDASRTFANNDLYLSDLHEENVLNQEHKRYYVIDGDFRLNTPEAGIGGTRQIDDSIVSNNDDGLLFRSSGITHKMDEEYLAAVESGDMETAQRLVNEAAKLAMPNTKVVDENGNPKVVYHQTNQKVYVNRETGQNWDDVDWKERMEWDERDDWEDYWEEQDFNTFSRVNARNTNEFDGFFFAPKYDEYHEYGDRTIPAFLNIENPASRDDYNIDASKNYAGRDERIRLQEAGFDGVIRMDGDVVDEYIAFEPSQIKSADPVTYDYNGNVIPLSERFNPEKKDIRYRKSDVQNAAINYLAGEPRLRAIERAVNDEAKKLGVAVTYKTREEMPKGHKNDKGHYNTKTGEIVICTENNASIADAIQTILHEAVAHKGLRQLMGDRFNEFINRVYNALDDETNAKVDELAEKHYNGNKTVAVEEYMANLAETEDFANNSVWNKIKKIFEGIINKILGRSDIKIGDNELRYILRASYANMVNPRIMDTVDGWAKDINMREEYKINEATPELLSRTGIDPTEVARESARATYDRVVNDKWQEFQRQFQDAMQPVSIAIDAIQQETGNIPIEDYENYILIQNQASSRSRVEIDDFSRRYYSPIIDQVNHLIDVIMESRGWNVNDKKRRSEVYKEVRTYLIAKHGLERNRYYQRTKKRLLNASERKEARAEAEAYYEAELARIASTYTGSERAVEEEKAKAEYEGMLEEIKTRTTADIRDYSGLTSLFGMKPNEFEFAEAEAEDLIKRFETVFGRTDEYDSYGNIIVHQGEEINRLWNRINAATDKTLRHSYESGMLSRQQYNEIRSMFAFYIPLRGFDETTAEDVYSYARFEGNRFNPAVQTAKGRTSVADDPLAFIMNMAESEITQGNKNRAKQALYNYLLNRSAGNEKQNSLMQIESVWYIKSTDANGNEVYQIAAPDHEKGETFEEFENRMQSEEADGNAVKSKKGQVDVGMRFQKQMNRNAHYVYLKVNGVDKAIYINGDPKAADAINGKYAPMPSELMQKAKDIQRLVSSTFTNYSLEFTARNYFRDMIYSHINIGVKEPDPAYRKKFRQNWRHNNLGTMIKMLKAYRAGEYNNRPLTEDEAAFVEFMNNGGQTGYTLINSVEAHKKDIERAIEHMQKGIVKGGIKDSTIFKYTLGAVELLNEASELVTRFAAYKTSRDMGRGINRSINDAKEVTVNFNTKGAQDGKGWMGIVARYLGAVKYFFNASVQGVQNLYAAFQKNKLKFGTVVGGTIGLGMMMPIIQGALCELLGGDEDEYWNIPEYDRQNNLCFVIGKGKYVKLPLPIGFREMYGLGDLIMAGIADKKFTRSPLSVGMDVANKIATIVLPINPLEGSANGLSLIESAQDMLLPDVAQGAVQNRTNTDFKGAPIQKEYTYNEHNPQWTKAFANNPAWLTGLSKWCYEHLEYNGVGWDWSPEKLDNTFSNAFGGIYSLIKKTGRTVSAIWNEDNRTLSNVPLVGVIVGSNIDDDERFVNSAYWEMDEYYNKRIHKIKSTADNFGLTLDDVFARKDEGERAGEHQPAMNKIYNSDYFDFMQEWYLGHKGEGEVDENGNDILGLNQIKNEIKDLERKVKKNEDRKPTTEQEEELIELNNDYETTRRKLVNDLLELD